jgi:hypothetical protein
MLLPKMMAAAAAPLQYVALATALTVARGSTVTEAVNDAADGHPFAVAVMTKLEVCDVSVVLVSVPVIVGPEPLGSIPVRLPVLFLVQLYVTGPGTLFGFDIVIVLIGDPEHTVWVAGSAVTVGMGFTTTVCDDVPGQSLFGSV